MKQQIEVYALVERGYALVGCYRAGGKLASRVFEIDLDLARVFLP